MRKIVHSRTAQFFKIRLLECDDSTTCWSVIIVTIMGICCDDVMIHLFGALSCVWVASNLDQLGLDALKLTLHDLERLILFELGEEKDVGQLTAFRV